MAYVRNITENPRYEMQYCTWRGFKETGVWVIARIMFVPLLVWCMFYFGSDAVANAPGNAWNAKSSLNPVSAAMAKIESTLSGLSSGRLTSQSSVYGFVGSSHPGAKWGKP